MEGKLNEKFFINTLDSDKNYTDRSKTLLLVVDVQEKIMRSTARSEKAMKNILALISAFKKFEMKIIATEQYPQGLGRSDDRILQQLSDDKIFEKTSFNAAIPEVLDYLKENDIKNIVITGTEGHVCVYQSVRSFLNLGYNVFYVDDGITSFSEKLRKLARNTLKDMGAVLVNTEVVLFDLARDSKDSNFKFISNLVKEIRK